MAESNATHWYPTAAYLYVLHLDGPALAWEYLRRNPDYQRDWVHRGTDSQRVAHRWGLRLFEDPDCDARDAQLDWMPDPDDLVQVRPEADMSADTQPFRMWRLPGYKSLTHDGDRWILTCHLVHRTLRIAIAPTLEEGMPYVFAVRAGTRLNHRWRAIGTELSLLDGTYAETNAVTAHRPGRSALLHLRTLQALDGVLAGASQRAVAEALFGGAAVAQSWYDDSDLRAQVRRVIRRGRVFMRGGYRHLVHGDNKEKGRSR